MQQAKQAMRAAKTFKEWQQHAERADSLEGLDLWRQNPASRHYDYRLIRSRLDSLIAPASAMDIGRASQIMFLLRAGMIRNLGGMCNARLYRKSRVGTKKLIEEYVAEVGRQLQAMAAFEHAELGTAAKCEFFRDMLQGFGRTALILHGGASFGLCHLGVAQCLHESGLLPKIICGSYIGALIAAAICVRDERGLGELLSGATLDLEPFRKRGGAPLSLFRKLARLVRHGRLFDVRVLEEAARVNIGDCTFKEAFLRSGRILNITVHSRRKHQVPVLLNYLTAPDVVIWSAACASCAVPGFFESATLLAKAPSGEVGPWHPSTVRIQSASVPSEVPAERLSQWFNVNSFIVSQVPSYFSIQMSPSDEAERSSLTGRLVRLAGDEIAHRYRQAKELGLVPDSLARLERYFHAPLAGDVTISPSIAFSDIRYIANNPDHRFVDYCMAKGARSVWKRLGQIQIRAAIEIGLDRIDCQLRNEVSVKQLQTLSIDSVFGVQCAEEKSKNCPKRTRSLEM